MILGRIAEGDPTATEDCLKCYADLVWSLARRYCRSKAEAEDAVQEIFIDLWKSAGRFDSSKATECTFVAMIARRRLIDRIRRNSTQPEIDRLSTDQPLAQRTEVDHDLQLAEDADQARKCLDQLADDEKSIVEKTVCHGDSQSTVARTLGMPLGTVKSHARRGLIKLRDCMKSHDFGLSGGSAQ